MSICIIAATQVYRFKNPDVPWNIQPPNAIKEIKIYHLTRTSVSDALFISLSTYKYEWYKGWTKLPFQCNRYQGLIFIHSAVVYEYRMSVVLTSNAGHNVFLFFVNYGKCCYIDRRVFFTRYILFFKMCYFLVWYISLILINMFAKIKYVKM